MSGSSQKRPDVVRIIQIVLLAAILVTFVILLVQGIGLLTREYDSIFPGMPHESTRSAADERTQAPLPTHTGATLPRAGDDPGRTQALQTSEPQPTQPQPTQPQPTQPQSTEAQPTQPQPTQPEPTQPQPTQPEPTEPQPNVPVILPTEPRPSVPAGVPAVPDTISRDYFLEGQGFYYHGVKRDLETGNVTIERYGGTLRLENTLAPYGAITSKNFGEKIVYLTFDCGYENGNTARILDVLKEKGVRAIFFCAGDFINDPANRPLLLRMIEEGHLIGNHTDHHKQMYKLSDEEVVAELNGLQNKLNALLGFEYQLVYYRPPQGDASERDVYLAKQLGYTTVFWSFAYYDYDTADQPEPSAALTKAKQGLFDGCVYLLHAVSSTNATILPDLIDYARAQGYEIRRLDQ